MQLHEGKEKKALWGKNILGVNQKIKHFSSDEQVSIISRMCEKKEET